MAAPESSTGTTRLFALNIHANYQCRHSGACCTAGWPIPVEPERRRTLGANVLVPLADGACRFYDRPSHLCRVHRDHGEAILPSSCFHFPRRALIDDRGVFVSLSHFCPTAARLLVETKGPLRIVETPPAFPADREYEGLDGRGTWPPLIKADLLFDLESFDAWERFALDALADQTLTVPAALRRLAAAAEDLRAWRPEDGTLLDRVRQLATRAWTHEELAHAWGRYERFTELQAYETLGTCVPKGLTAPTLSPEDRDQWRRVSSLVGAPPRPPAFASSVEAGRSGHEALMLPSRRPPARSLAGAPCAAPLPRGRAVRAAAVRPVERVRTSRSAPHSGPIALSRHVVGRYVAAKLFGSWAAYEASGLRTMVAELAVADLVLRVEAVRRLANEQTALDVEAWVGAVRAADWLLVHLVERPALINWLGAVEHDS